MNTEPLPAVTAPGGVLGAPPKSAKLTTRQKRMQKAISYMQGYMASYSKQTACLDYGDATFIDDVLYGLGAALHGTSCSYASGYEAWKEKLREHLKTA